MVCTPLVTESNTVIGYVCGPARRYRRYYGQCETCERNRRMVRRWDGMYYGYTEMCCHCGTMWMDGCEMKTRNPKQARSWWAEAEPARKFDAWVSHTQRTYFDD